jgi:hypothetical protein
LESSWTLISRKIDVTTAVHQPKDQNPPAPLINRKNEIRLRRLHERSKSPAPSIN